MRTRLLFSLAAMLMTASISLADREERLRAELPPLVEKYFDMHYPFARITAVARKVEQGEEHFEIQSRDYGQQRTVLFKSNGAVLRTRVTMPGSDLPLFVSESIRDAHPRARIRQVTKDYHWTGITYEILIRAHDRNTQRLNVTFDGRVAETS